MEIKFDEENKRLTIIDCFYDAIEIHKNNEKIFDVDLTEGKVEISNTDLIEIDDTCMFYPYNKIEVVIEASQTI